MIEERKKKSEKKPEIKLAVAQAVERGRVSHYRADVFC